MNEVTHKRHRIGQRLAGSFVLGLVLTIALAPVASAQIPTVTDTTKVVNDTAQVVKDTTDKVGDTVTDTGGKVGDTVTDTGGTVGDTVDGTVGGVVKDTTKKAGDTVKEGSETTGGAVKGTGDTVDKIYGDTKGSLDGVISEVGGSLDGEGATGPVGKKKGSKKNSESTNGASAPSTASRSAFPLSGAEVRYIEPATVAEVAALETASSFIDARTPQQFFEAAIEAAKRFAFPLALTLLVVAFLVIQNKVDSKDPKLAMASISQEEELLSFT